MEITLIPQELSGIKTEVDRTINGRNYSRDRRRNANSLGTEKGMNQKSDTLR